MGPGDGVSVDEGEELLEDGEEGPVREDADARLHLQAAVGDGPPVDDAQQTEADALPLRQQLSAERLVKLDGGAVNLQGRSKDGDVTAVHELGASLRFRGRTERRARCSVWFLSNILITNNTTDLLHPLICGSS